MVVPNEVREAIGEAVDNEMAAQVEAGPLSYVKVGDAALSALEAAGFEVNRKGTREALEPFVRAGAMVDDEYVHITVREDDLFRAAAMLAPTQGKEQADDR